MNKYKNTYRIPSTRLLHWDYGHNAAYFVTICTHDRQNFFGEISDGQMVLSEIGQLANQFWLEIPNHFSFVRLGAFVIMPNHVHGIIIIDKPNDGENENKNGNVHNANNVQNVQNVQNVETRQCLVSTNTDTDTNTNTNTKTIGQKRFQNQGKNTLSSIIGSYKSVVTKRARSINPAFAWQRNYYEHIIRNDESYYRISEYINNNPLNWGKDDYYDR